MYLVRALRHGCWAQQALLADAMHSVPGTMRPYPSTSQRFANTYTLPSTDSIGDPSAFWEKKMFQRFERMDFNKLNCRTNAPHIGQGCLSVGRAPAKNPWQEEISSSVFPNFHNLLHCMDGYICWQDLDSQMKYMLVSHNHDEKTMEKITTLFEDAWRRVWSFGVRLKDMRVSKREFVHGYTHIIKRAEARRSLSTTLEDLLGGCFDIFDDTLHGERTGQMSKEKFVAYQMCWNVTAEEAEQLFHEITPSSETPATHITKEQYLHAAWDFYFHMNESKSTGKNFFGTLRKKKLHLLL